MTRVFVDTSALLAILDEADPLHHTAIRLLEESLIRHDLVTHNYVHVEAEQLVRRRLGADAAVRLLEELLPAMETIWIDEATHARAVQTMSSLGRSASLVDQVSFIVMRRLEVELALAFDADFEAAGFRLPAVADARRHGLSEAPAPYEETPHPGDLVSVTELAARSGRSINTIQSWRRRHDDFPQPHVELAAGPIWIWSDAKAWIDQRTHRAEARVSR